MDSRIWTGLKEFGCYCIPFFPCCPTIGDPREGDCIIVQAFGRNSIPEDILGKVIRDLRAEHTSLDALFTVLKRKKFHPGKPNWSLARKVLSFAGDDTPLIIGQWEVLYCVWEYDRRWFLSHQERIDCLWPREIGYYSTWDLHVEAKQCMERRNKKRPIEICHPAMAARVIAIAWKLKINAVIEGVYPWSFHNHPLWVWDEKTLQPWTRNFIKFGDPRNWWLARESFGRYIHHPRKGYISFVQPC